MRTLSPVHRWLATCLTLAIVAAALAIARFLGGAVSASNGAGFVPDPQRADPAPSWPMFGGNPSRNMVNLTEKGLPVDWDVTNQPFKNMKWVAKLGSKAFGGPVIAGGKIFIGTNNQNPRDKRDIDPKTMRPIDRGVMMCFRESDGAFLWQAIHAKLPGGRVNDWPLEGIPSMPVVEGNRLYYVSNRCGLVCADTEGFLDGKNDGVQEETRVGPADADIIWRLDMIATLGVFPHNLAICSPLIDGDLIFVVTGNGVDEDHISIPAPAAPSFVAVDKRTGKVAWQNNAPTERLIGVAAQGPARLALIQQMQNRGELLMHGQWSNPTLAHVDRRAQIIFPGGDGWLRGFEPRTGELLWKFDCNPKASTWEFAGKGTRNDFIATPVVHGKRLYIGVGGDPEHLPGIGHLWCIDLERATARGRINKDRDVSPVGDNFDPRAAANQNSALAWHHGGPINDPEERKKLRRNYYFGRTLSTCAVHDGLCYAADLRGLIDCLDAETGQVYWTHDTKAQTWSSPFYADGRVYLGTDGSDVHVLAHGKQKKILAVNEMDDCVRGVPVALNGVLYVITHTHLYALAIDKKK